jgi:hypothetical protein
MTTTGKMAAAILAATALWLGGCGGRPGEIASPEATLSAEEGSPGFLDRVSSRPEVSQNDAARGMLMLVGEAEPEATFARRVENLRRLDLAPGRWRWDAEAPIDRARLAYMVYQACEVRGGLMLTITGPNRRYCLKELQYQGIIGEGSGFTPVSGMEFVAIIARADAYLSTGEVPETLSPITGD